MTRVTLPLVILAATLLLLRLVPTRPEDARHWAARATTYSAGPEGSRAFYLLLGDLGVKVQQLRRPVYHELASHAVLWSFADEPYSLLEQRALLKFVESGGSLVAPPAALVDVLRNVAVGTPKVQTAALPLHAPRAAKVVLLHEPVFIEGVAEPARALVTDDVGRPVVAEWHIGKGRIVSLGLHEISENRQIGQGDNGLFMVGLALQLGEEHVFDEMRTGFGEGDLMSLIVRAPYRWGVAQLVLLGLFGLASLVPRRFPVLPPHKIERRNTTDHLHAVARLWQRAEDGRLPLRAIMAAANDRARTRSYGGVQPFVNWVSMRRPELADRAQGAWRQAEAIVAGVRPDLDDARTAAVALVELEKETMRWSNSR